MQTRAGRLVRPPLIVRAAGNDLPTGTRRSDPAGYRRRQPGTAGSNREPPTPATYRGRQPGTAGSSIRALGNNVDHGEGSR